MVAEAPVAHCAPEQLFFPLDGYSSYALWITCGAITVHLSSIAFVAPPTLAGPTDSDRAHRRTRRRHTFHKSPLQQSSRLGRMGGTGRGSLSCGDMLQCEWR